jgi:CBS domain-containing protein
VEIGCGLREAMAQMTTRSVRHLVVVDHGRPLGLVSIGDLVKATIAEQEGAITTLQHYITGTPE